MTKCYEHEECEFNGQPECRLPDGMECPHGAKADKPTNADRIRSMSNEELSKFLCEFRSCDSDGYPCSGCKAESYCRAGHNGMEDWLQQPAEEEDT